MINTTDEPEVNEEAQLPPVVPDSEIPRSRTHPVYHPIKQQPMQRHRENQPMQRYHQNPKAEPTQGAEHAQPVDQPAVNRPRRERHKPAYLKDYVLA